MTITVAEKRCSKCCETKPLEAFPPRASEPGHTSHCRECRRAAQRVYRAKHKARDQRAQAERRRDPLFRRELAVRWRFKKYGLTDAQYIGMLIAQSGRCAICDEPMDDPHVDHCHRTKRVRGLLCGRCNRALGLLKDSPARLLSAVEYLIA